MSMGTAMNPLACPRCEHIDQVQSVATVYTAETGVHEGTTTGASTGLAVGGFGLAPVSMAHRVHTSGTLASQLALLVAPPSEPRRPPRTRAVKGLVAVGIVGSAGLLLTLSAIFPSDAPSPQARAVGVVGGLGLVLVSLVVLWFVQRHRRREWVGYQAARQIWPHAARTWWEAMVCRRCYVAFYPPGALPGVAAARQMIPLPELRSTQLRIAEQLAELGEPAGARPDAGRVPAVRPLP
jgi:hypothetical protein